jgi:hypothetical protein
MRSRCLTIWFMAAVLVMAADQGFGVVDFNDGATHNINYMIRLDDVRVDYQAPGKQTTVNMLAGGSSYFPMTTNVYNNGRLNIFDGSEVFFLYAHDNCKITMSGGFSHSLYTYNSSQLTMSGGTVSYLYAGGSSNVIMSGGTIKTDMVLTTNAELILDGSNFAVDGNPVGFGEITSLLGGDYSNEPYRALTGTLVDGDMLNSPFRIGDYASIVLVPEPATLLLLGLGAAMLRKMK